MDMEQLQRLCHSLDDSVDDLEKTVLIHDSQGAANAEDALERVL